MKEKLLNELRETGLIYKSSVKEIDIKEIDNIFDFLISNKQEKNLMFFIDDRIRRKIDRFFYGLSSTGLTHHHFDGVSITTITYGKFTVDFTPAAFLDHPFVFELRDKSNNYFYEIYIINKCDYNKFKESKIELEKLLNII